MSFVTAQELEAFDKEPKEILDDDENDEASEDLLAFFSSGEEIEIQEEELTSKTIQIREGETGHSYESLFAPYFEGANKISVRDPYIRLEYQIRNLIVFASLLEPSKGQKELHLTTSAEDGYQEKVIEQKLEELASDLASHGVEFTFSISPTLHDRSIEIDNGWKIYPGRGLDIYQRPESRYELSGIDQTKRACRETEIVFVKS